MATLQRKARITGLLYLGLAISGAAGFLTLRPILYAADSSAATLQNLVDHAYLARAGVALELLVVLTQALVAVAFYRLFTTTEGRAEDDPEEKTEERAGIAAFGLVNSAVILVSAALLGTAAAIAREPFGDAADTVQLLYLMSGHLWTAGGIFFGLWLIPMGRAVLTTGWMPRALGWLLVAGGIGYVLSAFAAYLLPPAVKDVLVVPASIGEFWMIGYLLLRGVRPAPLSPARVRAGRAAPPG